MPASFTTGISFSSEITSKKFHRRLSSKAFRLFNMFLLFTFFRFFCKRLSKRILKSLYPEEAEAAVLSYP